MQDRKQIGQLGARPIGMGRGGWWNAVEHTLLDGVDDFPKLVQIAGVGLMISRIAVDFFDGKRPSPATANRRAA